MTPLAIGALLAVAALAWVIAPVFGDESREESRGRDPTGADEAAADAAEAAIRKWRKPSR